MLSKLAKLIGLNLLIISLSSLWLGCDDLEPISSPPEEMNQVETIDSEEPQPEKVKVQFQTELSAADLTELSREFDFEVREITFENGELTGGFTLQTNNLEQGLALAREAHLHDLAQLREVLQQEEADQPSTEETPGAPSGYQTVDDWLTDSMGGDFNFTDATIKVAPGNLKQLADKQLIEVVETSHLKAGRSRIIKGFNNPEFVPYKGRTLVRPNLLYSQMWFSPKHRAEYAETYEHEVQIYDNQYAKKTGRWFSNLPGAYLDTEAFEPDRRILNFAVGSSYAKGIRPNRRYITYMSLKQKRKNLNPLVIVKGQQGRRIPPFIFRNPWVVHGTVTTSLKRSEVTRPGTWIYWDRRPVGVPWTRLAAPSNQ